LRVALSPIGKKRASPRFGTLYLLTLIRDQRNGTIPLTDAAIAYIVGHHINLSDSATGGARLTNVGRI
jgi:hypothetical protein